MSLEEALAEIDRLRNICRLKDQRIAAAEEKLGIMVDINERLRKQIDLSRQRMIEAVEEVLS